MLTQLVSPKWGDLADQLTEILMLHDPSVAAVIMEPIAGSAGVYLPPVGYLNRIKKYVMSMEFYSSLMKSLPDLAELEVILVQMHSM